MTRDDDCLSQVKIIYEGSLWSCAYHVCGFVHVSVRGGSATHLMLAVLPIFQETAY